MGFYSLNPLSPGGWTECWTKPGFRTGCGA